MRRTFPTAAALALVSFLPLGRAEAPKPQKPLSPLEIIIQETQPLKFPRGNRLPLYLWSCRPSGQETDAQLEEILKKLDERGIGLFSAWNAGANTDKCLEFCLRVGKLQKKLGLMVNVDATGAVYSFCNGADETAHVAADGSKFFDMSFASYMKMGCPFALQGRYEPMKRQLEPFLKGYKDAGVPLDFWTADWEIDGAIEWNESWAHCKRCQQCRKSIPKIDDFTEFQKALRKIRCDMQNEVFCKTIKNYFPNALIGNYGTNPHDGFRYWYDYFEKDVAGVPGKKEQNAFYRQWADDFDATGYTCSMPVVYSWYRIYNDYTFKDKEYRWFYNMLLVATDAGKSTPAKTPVIPFVHWTTTCPPEPKDMPKDFVPMSEEKYKELLWHILLRGHDTLCMWCGGNELAQETRPLHAVYAAALEYKDFLDRGEPVIFDLPKRPGPVVSALRLDNRLLVRRTDFGAPGKAGKAKVKVEGKTIIVPEARGQCQIIPLE